MIQAFFIKMLQKIFQLKTSKIQKYIIFIKNRVKVRYKNIRKK